ncbi:MAG: GNAT family N-acetyltransferase [Burkholderiales bacterium]|nr:GNAT family N-acetyltransferase [Burkholderiales bacterium]
MFLQQTQDTQGVGKKLSLHFARSTSEILEAQRLRYRVFAEEMGARLSVAEEGVDSDIFDPFCQHLLVRDELTNEVVGTYRILDSMQAKKIGGFYSDDEFDLTRLNHLRDNMVEVGRSCVHPDYRNGATITMLWSGLAQYMQAHHYHYLIGCASISMSDGGHSAASIFNKLKGRSLSPSEYRVFPRCALPMDALNCNLESSPPPLLKGYLRLGAYVCGDPAWDPDFNTADLLMMLPLSRMSSRYEKHFMRKSPSPLLPE